LEADQRRRVRSLPEVHLMEDPTNSVRKPNQTPPEPPTPPSQSASTQKVSVNSLLTVNTDMQREYLEALERLSGVIGFRVPMKYIILYNKLSKEEKRLVKQLLVGVLEAVARGAVVVQQTQQVQQVLVNLNVVQPQEVHQVHPDELLRRDLELKERRLRLCLDELDLAKRERRGLDRRLAECERLRARLRQVLGELSQLQHLYRQGVLRTGGEVVRKLGELAAKLREDLD